MSNTFSFIIEIVAAMYYNFIKV